MIKRLFATVNVSAESKCGKAFNREERREFAEIAKKISGLRRKLWERPTEKPGLGRPGLGSLAWVDPLEFLIAASFC